MDGLIINNKNAYNVFGIMMGDKFLDSLYAPIPLKDYISNTSRLEHGTRVVDASPKLAMRSLTLTFVIQGSNETEFNSRKNAFFAELYNRFIDIQTSVSDDVFHLVYTGNQITYSQNRRRTICKVSAKFDEPNPSNRE